MGEMMFKNRALPDARAFREKIEESLSAPKIKDIVWLGLTDKIRVDRLIGQDLARSARLIGSFIDPPCYCERAYSDDYEELSNQLRHADYLSRLARKGPVSMEFAYRAYNGTEFKKALKWLQPAEEAPGTVETMDQDQSGVQPKLYVVK